MERDMPAPSILVTFVDDDGDEFPMRVMGEEPSSHLRSRYQPHVTEARRRALALIDSGHIKPNGELKYLKSEQLNARGA
jgi:hypothetical protein